MSQKIKNTDEVLAVFLDGFSWAQAILSVYGGRSGLDRETALRIAGAFGAGMARTGQTCGAVTGSLMVIGLHHAKTRKDDDDSRERAYALAQEFMDAFRERNGSLLMIPAENLYSYAVKCLSMTFQRCVANNIIQHSYAAAVKSTDIILQKDPGFRDSQLIGDTLRD